MSAVTVLAVDVPSTYAIDRPNQRWTWLMPNIDSFVYALPTIRYQASSSGCFRANATYESDI